MATASSQRERKYSSSPGKGRAAQRHATRQCHEWNGRWWWLCPAANRPTYRGERRFHGRLCVRRIKQLPSTYG